MNIKRLWSGIGSLLLLALSAQSFASVNADSWLRYKQRFVTEGRVVDSGNQQISHSEGQGYGMLLAEINGDRDTFDQLWKWTHKNLYREDNGLFSWRYDPAKHEVSDRNDATDGDVLIGWALLRAGKRWKETGYIKASEGIQCALLSHGVISWAGKTVMLPGVEGFQHPGFININPSYFIFPAWQDFYTYSHRADWKKLIDDGLTLLDGMRFGKHRLPTDWVTVGQDGSLEPAVDWPARFGYDAVRIPLYLNWYQKGLPQNRIFTAFWEKQPEWKTPAWVNVYTDSVADYPLSPGMQSIRNLTVGSPNGDVWNQRYSEEDYYSSSLRLLSQAADSEAKTAAHTG
jgi:endoglucanase